MDILHTTSEVIDALGGYHAVAEITGRNPKAAENWRRFDSFPPNTYLAMTRALRAIGKDAPPELWRMNLPESSQ